MNREIWYQTYRDVRTQVGDENLFQRSEMAEIALEIAQAERREQRREARRRKTVPPRERLYHLVFSRDHEIKATATPDTHAHCMTIKAKCVNPHDWTVIEVG